MPHGAEAGIYLTPPGGGQTLRDVTLLDSSTAGLWVRGPETRSRHDADDSVGAAPAVAIKAVLFDAENVLYDASGWYRWFAEDFRAHRAADLEAEFFDRGGNAFCLSSSGATANFTSPSPRVSARLGSRRRTSKKSWRPAASAPRKEGSLRTLPGVRSTSVSCIPQVSSWAFLPTSTSLLRRSRMISLGWALPGSFARVVTSLDLGRICPSGAATRRPWSR